MTTEAPEAMNVEEAAPKPIRGAPKSGRWWKDAHSARHTTVIKSKPLKSSWDKKMAEKAKLKQVKAMQTEIRDKKIQEIQERKVRAKEQEERRLENERKSEIVQVIKNTSKLKKTKKKQLRMIQKRDTTNM